MKYAFWNLDATNPESQTGPEETIALAGGKAEASWTDGEAENNANILGYILEDFEADLSAWNFRYITQQEALDFCLEIDENAYLLPDGRITAPLQEI
jgi:hypothetical protein